ncbi:hypothetical protein FK85_25050 [Halorubrum saccharovorum]|uniref:Fibronectin type-III domain-containing protein n=1 Tax=Halorubrum saccharovorum TaxID=2248 RepID=A0A0F8BHZ6_9EURY|nr:fibronectin type III domain-containing protein [Halorubrum saccharovorum]KKF39893.1 hypothetical protein FK85_25050 [Halorubrum saccharovorum]
MTDATVTWTLNSTDEDGVRVYVKKSNESSWGSPEADLPAGAESATIVDVPDGAELDVRVEAYTADASSSDTLAPAATSPLPDEDQPVLGNGVEDEVAVDRETATTNNGDVRIQIRETGQSSWDSNATGFGEFVGAYNTLSMEFVGRLDGEEYEVRARTETEYATGAWTDPVSIITKFPGSDDLAVTVVSSTETALAWTDVADNEVGQRVVRERLGPDGSWWRERVLKDVGPNTETYTDTTAQPDREYRYRVRSYTEHAEADSNLETVETPALDGVRDRRVPASGPYVVIDHPDGDPLTPTITDIDWSPTVNERPTVEIEVPQSDRWEALTGQPMRVWRDGTQLPIDTLEGVSDSVGSSGTATTLEGSGGPQLDEYTDDIQIDEQEIHLAVRDLIDEYTDYGRNVDDPATDTRSDVLVLSETGNTLEDVLAEAIAATDPLGVTQVDGISMLQTGWFREAEDANVVDATTYYADQEGNDGAWSGNQSVRLESAGDGIEFEIETGHEIPADQFAARFLQAAVGGNPEIELFFDGTLIETFNTDFFIEDTDQFDLDWDTETVLNPDGAIPPGTHTVTLDVTAAGSGYLAVDAAHIADDRYSYTFDNQPVDEVVDGPEEYPPQIDVVFEDVVSVEQVIGGSLDAVLSSTAGAQAVAISNDEGTTWHEATNSETVSTAFADATQTLRARVTLSRYAQNPDLSPAQGDTGQSLDEIQLRADLEDTPVLLDKQYRDRLNGVLATIADDGRMVWELRRDPDAPADDPTGYIIEWTQIGQRSRASTAPATNVERRVTREESYDRVVVFGKSRGVEGSEFSVSSGATLTSIGNEWVVPDSERIYDPDTDQVFERGEDYRMDWAFGGLELLDGGDMTAGTTYAADYEWRYRGEATTPSVDASEARTVEKKIPSATSGRECDQLALSILKDVQEDQVEATLTVVEPAPDVPLVEAISHPRLPEASRRSAAWSARRRTSASTASRTGRRPARSSTT